MSFIAPGTRDTLPNGPSADEYTPGEWAAIEGEELSVRISAATNRCGADMPDYAAEEVRRWLRRWTAEVEQMEQWVGGSRA